MAGIGLTPSRSVVAENVRDLQPGHETYALGGRGPSPLGFRLRRSNGLMTARMVLVAMRV